MWNRPSSLRFLVLCQSWVLGGGHCPPVSPGYAYDCSVRSHAELLLASISYPGRADDSIHWSYILITLCSR